MFWKVEVLERRLVLSVFYDYDVVAKVGDATTQGDTITSFKGETSINDFGRVAFVANVTGANGTGPALITGDGRTTPVKISFANPAAGRTYEIPQITNDNQVVVKDSSGGTDFVRTWNALVPSPGSNSIIVKDGDKSPPLNIPYDIVQLPSRAEDGQVAFIGTVGNSTSPYVKGGAINTSLASVAGGGYRPMIGNGNRVVIRSQDGSGNQEILLTSPTLDKVLASSPTFTAVSQPGISDDGTVIAFAGNMAGANPATAGKGIYLSYFDGTQFVAPFKVAGIPNELGFDAAGNGLFLNDFDFSAIGATLSNRVGVVHGPDVGAAGIEDDTILLTFIATPSAASRPNPQVPAKPLLFSANKGIWTMKIVPAVPPRAVGAAKGTLNFNERTSPMPVVQVGDTIAGRVINDFTLFDPLASAKADQSGSVRATVDPGDHFVVFHAITAAGDEVIRAAQLDTDGDGLYDHWEAPGKGIDIDQDGTYDLDLSALGANPNHKDLFMEVDWLKPDAATRRDFSPQKATLDFFQSVFNNAPLTNPDGTTGVTVHIDAGNAPGLSRNMGAIALQGGDLISQAVTGAHIHVLYKGTVDPLIANPGGVDSIGRPFVSRSFESVKQTFFGTTTKDARELAFKYVVFADSWGVVSNAGVVSLQGSSGIAEVGLLNSATNAAGIIDTRFVPGNDVIVSLQGARSWVGGTLTVPTPAMGAPLTIPEPVGFLQGQTLVHEIGHTLGLRHGGNNFLTSGPPTAVTPAAKPNYRSLMNYAYQLDPDPTGALVRDYSRSGDAVFDDWGAVQLNFNEFFDNIGNTPNIRSRLSAGVGQDDLEEFDDTEDNMKDAIALNGPLDSQAPTLSISSPADHSSAATGTSLTINLTAADDGILASVQVSFDVNGDGTISPDETVDATPLGGGAFKAVFANLSGPAGQRAVTATATDTALFTDTESISVNVTSGAAPPPKVIASAFLYETLPHKLSFKFDQNVGASLAPEDFFVRKADGSGQITPTGVTFDEGSNTAIVSLPGKIPDGRYIVTLSSAGISSAGGQLDGDGNGTEGPDFDFQFLFLTGDANNDGQIGFADLVIVAQNYGKPQTDAHTGDLNYDGQTGFADLVLVAQHYGTGLPAAALPVAASPFAVSPVISAKSAPVRTASIKPATLKKTPPPPSPRPIAMPPLIQTPAKRRTTQSWLQST